MLGRQGRLGGQVFAQGHRLHLGSDNTGTRVVQLGDVAPWFGGQWTSPVRKAKPGEPRVFLVHAGGETREPPALLHVSAAQRPAVPCRRQSGPQVDGRLWVGVRTARVVNAHWGIGRLSGVRAMAKAGGRLGNFPDRHLDSRVQGAAQVRLSRTGQWPVGNARQRSGVDGEFLASHGLRFLRRHNPVQVRRVQRLRAVSARLPGLPYASFWRPMWPRAPRGCQSAG